MKSNKNTLQLLKEELYTYNSSLKEKPYIVVRSKIDIIINDESHIEWPIQIGDFIDISAVTGYGIDTLISLIDKKLKEK